MRLDPATGKTRAAAEGRAHRRPRLQQCRQVALGHPPPERHLHARADPAAVHGVGAGRTRGRTAPSCTTSTCRPTGDGSSASFGEIDGQAGRARARACEALQKGDATPVAQFDFGPSVPNNFTFSPDGRYLFGSSYYTGVSNIFRYELATRKLEAVIQHRDRLLPADSARRRRADRLPLHGRGFVPGHDRRDSRSRTSAPITFLGERLAEEHPSCKTWNVGSPLAIPYDTMKKDVEPYHLLRRTAAANRSIPIVQGYKDTAAVGVRLNFSDPLRLNRAIARRRRTARTRTSPSSERVHLEADYQRYDWRGYAELEQRRFLRPLRPDQGGPQGLRRRRSATRAR